MIEDNISDLLTFVNKLVTLVGDDQLRGLNHTFYSNYSLVRLAIRDELIKRDLSTECEFTENGDFKY